MLYSSVASLVEGCGLFGNTSYPSSPSQHHIIAAQNCPSCSGTSSKPSNAGFKVYERSAECYVCGAKYSIPELRSVILRERPDLLAELGLPENCIPDLDKFGAENNSYSFPYYIPGTDRIAYYALRSAADNTSVLGDKKLFAVALGRNLELFKAEPPDEWLSLFNFHMIKNFESSCVLIMDDEWISCEINKFTADHAFRFACAFVATCFCTYPGSVSLTELSPLRNRRVLYLADPKNYTDFKKRAESVGATVRYVEDREDYFAGLRAGDIEVYAQLKKISDDLFSKNDSFEEVPEKQSAARREKSDTTSMAEDFLLGELGMRVIIDPAMEKYAVFNSSVVGSMIHRIDESFTEKFVGICRIKKIPLTTMQKISAAKMGVLGGITPTYDRNRYVGSRYMFNDSSGKISVFSEEDKCYVITENGIEHGGYKEAGCYFPPLSEDERAPLTITPTQRSVREIITEALPGITESCLLTIGSYMCCAPFLAHVLHPILYLTGAQYGGKSTIADFIKHVIDPVYLRENAGKPGGIDSVHLEMRGNAVATFDNIPTFSLADESALCLIPTSFGVFNRKYYTNGKKFHIPCGGLYIATSVVNVFRKPELLSRTLTLDVSDCHVQARRNFFASLEDISPELRYAVFSVSQKMIPYVYDTDPRPEIRADPRLSNFYTLLERAAIMSGWEDKDVTKAFTDVFSTSKADIVTYNLYVQAMMDIYDELAESRRFLATDLHAILRCKVADKGGPKNLSPRAIGDNLNQCIPVLDKFGIPVKKSRTGGRWAYTFTKEKQKVENN